MEREHQARSSERTSVDQAAAAQRLLRACDHVERGMLAAARAEIDAAIELSHEGPSLEMAAGLLLFTTRDYQRSLDLLARAASRAPDAARPARRLAISVAAALGWEQDVRAMLEAAIADDPADLHARAHAIGLYARGRWWAQALVHAEAAIRLEPSSASLWMETAGLAAAIGLRPRAIEALRRALSLAPTDGRAPYLREAARVAVDAGDFVTAIACNRELCERDPAETDAWIGLAEIASWNDEADEARAHAERALASRPDHPRALRILGALAARAGRWDEALALLDGALESGTDDYQAHVFRAEVYLRTARYEEAHEELHHAAMKAGGYLFVAWMLRFLVNAYDERSTEAIPLRRTEEFEDALRELSPELGERALTTRAPDAMVAAIEDALAALGANRSIYATHKIQGELARVRARGGCRFESRWALQLLRVAEPSRCLAALDELVDKYPGSSLALCHRGELRLWLGQLERARADLELAIERFPQTRWAYMGLSTLDLLAGDPEASLATNARGVEAMGGTEGLAIHVFRGEALRRLGRLDEAIRELERAVAVHPARASATINLALAYAGRGDEAGARRLFQRLAFEQASGLLSDAAHELGLSIVGDAGALPAIDVMVKVLERALAMMGANRSSGLLTYWTARGHLRFVSRWPNQGRSPHDIDPSYITRVRAMLRRAAPRVEGAEPALGRASFVSGSSRSPSK